ncbi:transposase [Deinococcus sp. PEB2-63]
MGKQRKTWSTDLKEAIVLSVLRGELGVAEAARQHGVNESLIHTWKTQFLAAGRARLAGERHDHGITQVEREGSGNLTSVGRAVSGQELYRHRFPLRVLAT